MSASTTSAPAPAGRHESDASSPHNKLRLGPRYDQRTATPPSQPGFRCGGEYLLITTPDDHKDALDAQRTQKTDVARQEGSMGAGDSQ